MDLVSVALIAVGLAMDAFSVCISCGITIPRPDFGHYFRLAASFGFFQFIMPVIGFFGGMYLERHIKAYDHWLAFGLLAFIGLKMVRESFSGESAECPPGRRPDPSRGWSLLVLSVATSIDALAVGLSIGVLNRPILLPSIIIGVVCAIVSAIGVAIGSRVGPLFGRRAETVGGLVLIAIGIKILIEHMAF
ncbi:MAG: manganese efflux pump [Spirochaetes bacterium]|nr:manganese efflux pump [Spirochaetota bacterium]